MTEFKVQDMPAHEHNLLVELEEKLKLATEALEKIGIGLEYSEGRELAYEALEKIKS